MSQLPECDYCDKTEGLEKIDDSLVCSECKARGIHAANERQKQAAVNLAEYEKNKGPISINEVLTKSRDIDNRVAVRTDLFNAATVAIVELKKTIDSDDSIENKPFALAQELYNRYNKFKAVIFELNEKVVEASNQQKAVQIYLNNLANQLRADEREKIKISDINYKPKPLNLKELKGKVIKNTLKKIDKKELREKCAKNGVPEFSVQMMITAKHITIDEAVALVKQSIESAKSQTTEVK